MQKPIFYENKLKELLHRHFLVLEQCGSSFPLYKNDTDNKTYRQNYVNDKQNLEEATSLLNELHKTMAIENNALKKEITKTEETVESERVIYNKLSNENGSMNDTENALVEMTKDYKIKQSNSFLEVFDMSLGILIVFYFIYKKTQD